MSAHEVDPRSIVGPWPADESEAARATATGAPVHSVLDREFGPISFIGAGATGTVLALALSLAGFRVVAVASRTRDSAVRLASQLPDCEALEAQSAVDTASFVFVTTPDDAIATVVAGLRWRPGQAVVHCSGAASTDILSPARVAGCHVGGFHPLQTFASADTCRVSLAGTTFGVEAEPPLDDALAKLAGMLGGTSIHLTAADKSRYHAGAVFASNYLVTLAKLAADLWAPIGIDQATAIRALLPLLRGTLANLDQLGLPTSLTGPIARGDIGTVERHLGTLAGYPEVLAAYRLLGRSTVPIAEARGLDSLKAGALRALLAEPTAPNPFAGSPRQPTGSAPDPVPSVRRPATIARRKEPCE